MQDVGEARRGAAFFCQIAGAEHRRPTGVLTNVKGMERFLNTGWPSHKLHEDKLQYSWSAFTELSLCVRSSALWKGRSKETLIQALHLSLRSYFGRGCSARYLLFRATWPLGTRAINQFAQKLQRDEELWAKVWTLSGLRLVCHCKSSQACHADSIIEEFRRVYPGAFDRDDPEAKPPKSEILNYLAGFRMEPAPEDDSSADEEVPEKGAGWRGTSPPMSVGEGYATREHCDGGPWHRQVDGRWHGGAAQRPNCGRISRVAS